MTLTLLLMAMGEHFVSKRVMYFSGQRRARWKILIMKTNAQYNALSKAIRTRFKIENIYYATFFLRPGFHIL